MAQVVITLKIMPDSPDVDLDDIAGKANEKIKDFTGGGDTKKEIEPIAFGLKALKMRLVSDEDKGSTESLEKEIAEIKGVQSVDVVDVRRAIG